MQVLEQLRENTRQKGIEKPLIPNHEKRKRPGTAERFESELNGEYFFAYCSIGHAYAYGTPLAQK